MNARRVLFALAGSAAFDGAVARLPGARARAWRSARRYVAGERLEDALRVGAALGARGLATSVELLGERDVGAHVEVASRLPEGTWLSLDLGQIGFDVAGLARIADALSAGARVQIGAARVAETDRLLDGVLAAGGGRVDATLQANLRRTPADAQRLAAAGVPVRLVKGAFVEAGADALAWGPETNAAYERIALALGEAGAEVRLATHDDALLGRLLPRLPGADCEFLLGVRPERAASLAASGRRVRVYVPFGSDWLRYFMRRRAEAQGA